MCGGHEFLPQFEALKWQDFEQASLSRRRFLQTVAGVSGLALAATASRASAEPTRTAAARPMAGTQPRPMGAPVVNLKPVDAVDVALVIDGTMDYLLANAPGVIRHPLGYTSFASQNQLVAEHGFSALVTVESGGRRSSVLYDGGLTRFGLARNLSVMGVKTNDLRAITISHGHVDHHGGLEGLYRRTRRHAMPLVIHPDAWRDRKIVFPTGTEIHLPAPKKTDLARDGVHVVEEPGPSLLVDDTVLISGQVDRVTPFEKGFPIHYARLNGKWEKDPLILDDQNLIVNVKDKGLVIVSGCSHSGVVNVLKNAQRLTGESRIAGFVGGLHLSGAVFEPIIGPTIDALTAMGVGRVIPAHCTGWKAVHAIARSMPDAFVQPAVGTVVHFG